jgi:hypothetical protein
MPITHKARDSMEVRRRMGRDRSRRFGQSQRMEEGVRMNIRLGARRARTIRMCSLDARKGGRMSTHTGRGK